MQNLVSKLFSQIIASKFKEVVTARTMYITADLKGRKFYPQRCNVDLAALVNSKTCLISDIRDLSAVGPVCWCLHPYIFSPHFKLSMIHHSSHDSFQRNCFNLFKSLKTKTSIFFYHPLNFSFSSIFISITISLC